MRFFGLKNCDTCRKALKELGAAGLSPEVIDVRADGVSGPDLDAILTAFGDGALNKRSTTWRNLPQAEQTRPAVELLSEHPTLMKRPVIEANGQWFQGWTKDVQAALVGKGPKDA